MGRLRYTTAMSLDGYVADSTGDFQWAAPDPDIFDLHLSRMRQASVEVMGRRTHELMRYWEAPPEGEEWTPAEHEFTRLWRDLDKVVVSSSLGPDDVGPRTRLVRRLGTEDVAALVAAVDGTVEIYGPTTAADVIRAGMVDEFEFLVWPVVVGGGLRALPDDARLDLRLVEHGVLGPGVAHLRYESSGPLRA